MLSITAKLIWDQSSILGCVSGCVLVYMRVVWYVMCMVPQQDNALNHFTDNDMLE